MKTTILLNTIDKVKRFIEIVSGFDGEIDLSSGRYTIDAKSIMGIFSLNISDPLTLTIHNEEKAPELIEKISEFILNEPSEEE